MKRLSLLMALVIGFVSISGLSAMQDQDPRMNVRNLLASAPAARVNQPAAPTNPRTVWEIAGRVVQAPFKVPSKIVNAINRWFTDVEAPTELFKRCLIEGIVIGALFMYANSNGIASLADQRGVLANFAWEDMLSGTRMHFNDSVSIFYIMFAWLWYRLASLGISGTQLLAWTFAGLMILCFVYDFVVRLPISILCKRDEKRAAPKHPWFSHPE